MKGKFFSEDIQIYNEYMKGCSILLNIREIQIRYHIKPVIVKNTRNNELMRMWRNVNICALLVEL